MIMKIYAVQFFKGICISWDNHKHLHQNTLSLAPAEERTWSAAAGSRSAGSHIHQGSHQIIYIRVYNNLLLWCINVSQGVLSAAVAVAVVLYLDLLTAAWFTLITNYSLPMFINLQCVCISRYFMR